jgi:hypothetical protein
VEQQDNARHQHAVERPHRVGEFAATTRPVAAIMASAAVLCMPM